MYRFCLSRQINEVEILKSVFCGEGELKVWSEEQYEKIKKDVDNWSGAQEEEEIPQLDLQLALPLDPPYPAATSVSLGVTMLPFYPSSDGVELKIRVPVKVMSAEQEVDLNDAASKFVAAKLGQECILDLVQFVKEWIYDNAPPALPPAPPVAKPASEPMHIEKPHPAESKKPEPATPSPSPALKDVKRNESVVLSISPASKESKITPSSSPAAKAVIPPNNANPNGSSKGHAKQAPPPVPVKAQEFRRILVWFSTIAPDRAKTVAEWAKQLGLTGISRLGSPAILLVEGQKEDVDEYVSSLRSFRWKKMDIVWEDRSRCNNINDCRKFTQFLECMMPLPELLPIFRNAGLEDMYKEGLKIRG